MDADCWSAIGSMLSGVFTALLFGFALYESWRWRQRLLATHRIEAERDALVHCFAALDALRFIVDDDVPKRWTGMKSADKEVWTAARYAERWDSATTVFRDLKGSMGLARVMLTNAQFETIREVNNLRLQIYAAQQEWLSNRRAFQDLANQVVAIGPDVVEWIDGLERRVIAELGTRT